MRILDKYILKRFLTTFVFTLLILIPIAIAIDVSEKIDNFLENPDLTFTEVIYDYYVNFIIYYTNTFMPLGLFIAVILFTSKLANNTEIIAISNARVSFVRFLYPYFLGATIITILALGMNHFVVPNSSTTRKNFEKKYINSARQKRELKFVQDFSLQLTDSTYIFIRTYNTENNVGYDFTSEIYNGFELKSKLAADRIQYNDRDSVFSLINWRFRERYKDRDSISSGVKLDTVFNFTPKDLVYQSSLSQEMPSDELLDFIEISKKRGVKNLNAYLVEFHKRTSLPIASYFLTLIAVCLAFRKRRGGTGINLAIGFGIMFMYVFLMKVFEVLGAVAGVNSFVYVWIPNLLFGALSVYLFLDARK